MRIAFEDTARPARIAQAIRRHLADRGHRLAPSASRDLVGRMFGYDSWAELARAPRGQDSLPDHLVSAEERASRQAQYRAALRAMGLDEALAEGTVAFVAPTGPFEPAALDGFDFLSDPPRAVRGLVGADAAAFAASRGGTRLLAALEAAALDDPFWGRRGARRIGNPDDAWLAGALDALRANPGHPQWAALALLCVGVVSEIMVPDHAYAGDLAPLLADRVRHGDAAGIAAIIETASEETLLALVAHVEDILPAQVGRRAPHRDSMIIHAVFVPSERQPWTPGSPFDLRRPIEGDREWTLDVLNDFGFHPPEAPPAVAVRIDDASGMETHIGIEPAKPGLGRDDVIRIGPPGGAPALLAVLRVRADPGAALFRVDVEGPCRISDCPDAYWEGCVNFLLAVILSRLDGDWRRWSRVIPPDGRLEMLVSPAKPGDDGRLMRDLVRTAGDRFGLMQARLPDLGFDLVTLQSGRDGRPQRLPALHLAVIPGAAREDWSTFESGFAHAAGAGQVAVLAQLKRDGPAIADSGGRALEGRSAVLDEAVEAMSSEEAERALHAVVAEAGLGAQAVVVACVDFTAVVSQAWLEDRDWTSGVEAALLVEAPPSEGERERLTRAFWSTFRDELDAIEAARELSGIPAGSLHQGSTARH